MLQPKDQQGVDEEEDEDDEEDDEEEGEGEEEEEEGDEGADGKNCLWRDWQMTPSVIIIL